MYTYLCIFVYLSSANEGAQHDQSKEKHWEVAIFCIYSVSAGADGQDA